MNNTPRETDEVQGATVYPTTPGADEASGTPGASSVRVYDRPDKPQQGVSMMTIILMLVALLVVAAIVWSLMT